jgi:perosamine synthetase
MIPVYKPYLNDEILSYAHSALDSTWISSKGQYIIEVENILSSIYSVNDARINSVLTMNNGTAAMHLVARLLSKEYPNITKIIVPNNVYVAAWNAFLFDKKYSLQAIDADANTWNYNLDQLYETLASSNLETTALLVVHNLGNIVNVPKIQRDWKGLVIVEDNCEGFGGTYEGYQSGSLSFASALSFFGNKNITCGEGGAVVAQNYHAGYLYKLRSQGQSETRFVHDELGYNYRMTNIQAAILYGQLAVKNVILEKKKLVFNLYHKLISNISEVKFQKLDNNTQHSNWMFGIKLNNGNYNEAEQFFGSNYIEVRPMFYPIHTHNHLQSVPCEHSNIAEQLNNQCIVLPSYPELQEHEICHIVNTLKQYIYSKK